MERSGTKEKISGKHLRRNILLKKIERPVQDFLGKIPGRIFPLDKEAPRISRVPRTSQEDLRVGYRESSSTSVEGFSSHVRN